MSSWEHCWKRHVFIRIWQSPGPPQPCSAHVMRYYRGLGTQGCQRLHQAAGPALRQQLQKKGSKELMEA